MNRVPIGFGRPWAVTVTAGPNLLVASPLFQQSGFCLPLDWDQVKLHNTLLCLGEGHWSTSKDCLHAVCQKNPYICVRFRSFTLSLFDRTMTLLYCHFISLQFYKKQDPGLGPLWACGCCTPQYF